MANNKHIFSLHISSTNLNSCFRIRPVPIKIPLYEHLLLKSKTVNYLDTFFRIYAIIKSAFNLETFYFKGLTNIFYLGLGLGACLFHDRSVMKLKAC